MSDYRDEREEWEVWEERAKDRIEAWAKRRIETLFEGAERISPEVDQKFAVVGKLIQSLVDALIELAKRQGIEASISEDDAKALKALGVEVEA